jgi:hypothetical protein
MAGGWEEVVWAVSWVETGAGTGGTLGKKSEADEAAVSKEDKAGEAVVVQAKWIWLISGATVTLNFLKKSKPNGTFHSGLQETGSEKIALKLNSFLNKSPRGDRLSICPFEKGTRWTRICSTGYNAQSCSSINQIPIISQFVSEKDQSGINWKMNSHGSGVCWYCCRTGKDSVAF